MKTYTYFEKQGKIVEAWCQTHCPNVRLELLRLELLGEIKIKYRFTFPDPQEETLFLMRWL